ncbi:Histidinol-phosphatase [Pirellulimonas nuda]|uniref:Histidinol-phosphatase n=1 Tax=Pirellulimonas nuda TaxID=2528009 RepID=A0A518DB55_9BACT|nr:histidinol-phosphatase [Pirellulimonas nuda]QDU88666.1 Histidinol-phosphatase [Pirellulimonas nuda]
MPQPTQSQVAQRLEFAVQIAHEAGAVTLDYFRSASLAVDRKSDGSPVTAADRAAETLLRERIAAEFPGDAVVGEEFGASPGDSGYTWVLDPIDGTKSFIHGVPLYTTLIGVLTGDTPDCGKPQAGVIHSPATGETAWAAIGQGCRLSGRSGAADRPGQVSSCGSLDESLVLTSEVVSFRRNRSGDALTKYLQLQDSARLVRTWGDGYGYLMLVGGRADVMLDPIMNLWDAAALMPIVTEAGGRFTDWRGEATVHSGDALATNGQVHQAVLDILAS